MCTGRVRRPTLTSRTVAQKNIEHHERLPNWWLSIGVTLSHRMLGDAFLGHTYATGVCGGRTLKAFACLSFCSPGKGQSPTKLGQHNASGVIMDTLRCSVPCLEKELDVRY